MDSHSKANLKRSREVSSSQLPPIDENFIENVDEGKNDNENNRANEVNEGDGANAIKDDDKDVDAPKLKKRKPMEKRSKFWAHFEEFEDENDNKMKKGRCLYCGRVIRASNNVHGTAGLKHHYEACKKKPHEVATNQARLQFQTTQHGQKGGGLVNWQFDQTKSVDALCRYIIVDEQPFRMVEKPGFRHFMSVICPMFNIPSRKTITKDIFNMYLNEKSQLKNLLKGHAQRVSITTDTWTSIQKVNYMCLTVHFIDQEWNLQKKILNFCPISGHKGEQLGKAIVKCLKDWGVDKKVFTVTVDNAYSNDGAVAYLKERFDDTDNANILGGKYMHMRCIAHIINLVVQDGLKGKDESVAITRIRGAVRYVRSSPARYQKFNNYAQLENLESNKMLCLDVPTRWNSTYLMLEAATNLKKVFQSYENEESSFRSDLDDGVPNRYDWDRASLLLKFLSHFYNLTLKVSGSLYVTTNLVFKEISSIDMLLTTWINSNDFELSDMARKMKEKYDKYWGSLDKMNKIIYFAVILDPRRKWAYLEFSFDKMYPNISASRIGSKGELMKEQVLRGFKELFDEYVRLYANTIQSSHNARAHGESSSQNFSGNEIYDLDDEFEKLKKGKDKNERSELDKYLNEDCERGVADFDILGWWKVEAHRFPILSKMARDILAVPVSTVASEAAFSTGGRILDAFRSSLSPKIAQALICAQDWFRADSKPVSVEEDLCELDKIDKELIALGADSSVLDP